MDQVTRFSVSLAEKLLYEGNCLYTLVVQIPFGEESYHLSSLILHLQLRTFALRLPLRCSFARALVDARLLMSCKVLRWALSIDQLNARVL